MIYSFIFILTILNFAKSFNCPSGYGYIRSFCSSFTGSFCSLTNSQICKCENNLGNPACGLCNGEIYSHFNVDPVCYGDTYTNSSLLIKNVRYASENSDIYFKISTTRASVGSDESIIRNATFTGINNGYLTIEVWDYNLIFSDDLIEKVSFDFTDYVNENERNILISGVSFSMEYKDLSRSSCSCLNCPIGTSCNGCICSCDELCSNSNGFCFENECRCSLDCSECFIEDNKFKCSSDNSGPSSSSSTGSNSMIPPPGVDNPPISSSSSIYYVNYALIHLIVFLSIMKLI